MHTSTATAKAATTGSTYVPPNKRKQPQTMTAFPRAEKKEPKKEFSLTAPELFPTLGETLKKTSLCNKTISFSSAAAKQKEVPKEVKSEILPGWLHIRKHNGIIEYKYGATMPRIDYSEQDEKFLCKTLYNNRLARYQYDRDIDVERLGDLSEYFGAPSLAEIQEEYETNEEINYNSSSEESDMEYY